MTYCCAQHDWSDDDWWDDDLTPARAEPDNDCWTCDDSGVVQGATREVNCPDCRPTPRQRRRQRLVDAWRLRRHHRHAERDLAVSHMFDLEAPF